QSTDDCTYHHICITPYEQLRANEVTDRYWGNCHQEQPEQQEDIADNCTGLADERQHRCNWCEGDKCEPDDTCYSDSRPCYISSSLYKSGSYCSTEHSSQTDHHGK